MVITVHSLKAVLIVFWIRSSVSRSTAAVASSKIRILDFRSKALAKHTNWRWPTLHVKHNVLFIIVYTSQYYLFRDQLILRRWFSAETENLHDRERSKLTKKINPLQNMSIYIRKTICPSYKKTTKTLNINGLPTLDNNDNTMIHIQGWHSSTGDSREVPHWWTMVLILFIQQISC